MSIPMENRKYIQSVERAFSILTYIADHGTVRLNEISEASHLKNTTAFGLLQTLEHTGYIARTNKGLDYCLGLNSMKLGLSYTISSNLKKKLHHILSTLTREVKETSYFELKIGKRYYYYEVVLSPQPLKVVPGEDRFIELPDNSAVAKVYAGFSDGFRYATDLEEVTKGLNCFAVPYATGGTLVGCIALSGPSSRFTKDKMEEAYRIYRRVLEETENETP
jgi:IclR family acetate operon transcriptional repressor